MVNSSLPSIQISLCHIQLPYSHSPILFLLYSILVYINRFSTNDLSSIETNRNCNFPISEDELIITNIPFSAFKLGCLY